MTWVWASFALVACQQLAGYEEAPRPDASVARDSSGAEMLRRDAGPKDNRAEDVLLVDAASDATSMLDASEDSTSTELSSMDAPARDISDDASHDVTPPPDQALGDLYDEACVIALARFDLLLLQAKRCSRLNDCNRVVEDPCGCQVAVAMTPSNLEDVKLEIATVCPPSAYPCPAQCASFGEGTCKYGTCVTYYLD